MVNIPPLLCSTPPPIDFGEDDEDVDVLPASLENVEDEFGDFLVEDSIKSNESLPSPTTPSVCDLPPVSIYDGLLPFDEENLTNHIKTTSPEPSDAKNIEKSGNFTEAFNFNIRNTNNDLREVLQNEDKSPTKELKIVEYAEHVHETENVSSVVLETESENFDPSSQSVCLETISNSNNLALSKNVKYLKIEPVNDELKCRANEINVNVVSIEDIEDDLSDDEVYSPKTPKNYVETESMTDFFKIEEVKGENNTGNKANLDFLDTDPKSSDSLSNNESAPLGNDNDSEFKSFSSNSFIQNKFDTPPPLPDDSKSIDSDDDFGDFADFQETHFVTNTVPVNEICIKENNKDLETNDFNDFTKFNESKDYLNFKNGEFNERKTESEVTVNIKEVRYINQVDVREKQDEVFDSRSSNNSSFSYKFDIECDEISQKIRDLEVKTQEINNAKTESLSAVHKNFENDVDSSCLNENTHTVKENESHKDDSSSDFSLPTETNDNEDFGNFAEFSNTPSDCPNFKEIESTELTNDISNDDDEFNNFADFEPHQDVTPTEEKDALSNENEDDDDFGDFNTAEPSIVTASSSIVSKTSHNTNSQAPVLPSKNINERISKILQLMFIQNVSAVESTSNEPNANKILDIPFTSIDAAKALEYQWLVSSTRHALIRSLGIDSRNILYGDNWNPSLPRFAANLSFNPLKPMKPKQPSAGDSNSTLGPTSISSSEVTQEMQISNTIKKDTLDLDWKSAGADEQTTEAFKENNFTVPTDSITAMPYLSNEAPTTEPEPAIFENTLDNENKFSKTPPISEMESVSTFSSSLPPVAMDMDLSATEIEMEENLKNSLNINEVVVTSTFSGSFKETHIYTPPKMNDFENKHEPPTSPTKNSPIDFDYEKAAMGVIIDETVVKKEYRDVEYTPPFTMESLSKSISSKMDLFETSNNVNSNPNILSSVDTRNADQEEQGNDDFSEFQSVSSEVAESTETVKPAIFKSLEVPKTTTVSHGGMILSPAILIPQAISMENQKPKIEWGDSTANINPEELARIEELFPEPKNIKSSNSSQKSTPTHQLASTPSISATVANKELEGNINTNDDDDDWSDFVSVSVTNNISTNRTGSNNNILTKSPACSPFQQRSPIVTHRMPPATHSNSNNDDEWSEFVSSAPPLQQPPAYRVPQFNSGAWQNANFYNNPLSMYHKGPLNIPTPSPTPHSTQKFLHNNNNNYNLSQQSYPTANNVPPVMLANNQQMPNNAYQQQIHVMQNFSTAPVPTPDRLSATAAAAKNNQFQSIGSAKVSPSIALIPDLGFVAPAIPTHTSFINSLPKPSINMKK